MEKLGGNKIKKIYEITETEKNYPKALLRIKKHPKKIYAMGNIALLQKKAVAIVGTREHTPYGEKYSKIFANYLAQNGITIISGLAIGIDSIAHRNALNTKGNTISVIGSGFYHLYPPENKELFDEIVNNKGCIISEYPPETEVNMSNFPTRNQIIAGLSKAVLVVEAKHRSGSSITARYAKKQGKPVFCIPNQIGIKTGVGTNNLIKEGATLVTTPKEILLTIGEEEKVKHTEVKQKIEKKDKKQKKIKKEYQLIYQALQKGPKSSDELAKEITENIVQINQNLTMMEIEGLIEMLPGNKVARKE